MIPTAGAFSWQPVSLEQQWELESIKKNCRRLTIKNSLLVERRHSPFGGGVTADEPNIITDSFKAVSVQF